MFLHIQYNLGDKYTSTSLFHCLIQRATIRNITIHHHHFCFEMESVVKLSLFHVAEKCEVVRIFCRDVFSFASPTRQNNYEILVKIVSYKLIVIKHFQIIPPPTECACMSLPDLHLLSAPNRLGHLWSSPKCSLFATLRKLKKTRPNSHSSLNIWYGLISCCEMLT